MASSAPVAAQLSESELLPTLAPFKLKNADTNRLLKPKEKQTLEDLFRRSDLRVTNAQPIDLGPVKIPGLPDKGLDQLAMNYFVVVSGTPYKKMSDVYTENRLEGKPNFITVDSIVHPYFGFTNGVLAEAVETRLAVDLKVLLKAMLVSSIADYRRTDDDEIKDDIQRNLAYLCVALKLLDPSGALPDIGGASELVAQDYDLIMKGQKGRSQIFSREEDFSTFKPWGWMSQRERTRRFYRAYQWLSRMQFALSNTGSNTMDGGGNSFRKAVLLYRSLILANTGKEPAVNRWNRIATVVALSGFDSNAKRKTILPIELQSVLKTSESDLDRLLSALSQPFLRTKLLLSVRNQRPVELNAKSVFEMGSGGGTAGDDVVFRMFPLADPPELVWLRESAHDYKEPAEGPPRVPLGLLSLHAHGAQQATNVLHEQLDTLDTGLAQTVPRLERLVKVVAPQDAQADRHWAILSRLCRPYPDSVQIGLRSELWLTKELETTLAAWIDSYSALSMIPKETDPTLAQAAGSAASAAAASVAASNAAVTSSPTSSSSSSSSSSSKTVQGAAGATVDYKNADSGGSISAAPATASDTARTRAAATNVRPARFHYLDPRLDVYMLLQEDCQSFVYQMEQLGCLPERYKGRSQDFLRLFKRLQSIAELEVKNEPLSMNDFSLLANIDKVLAPVDCPMSAYIYLDTSMILSSSQSSEVGKVQEVCNAGSTSGVTDAPRDANSSHAEATLQSKTKSGATRQSVIPGKSTETLTGSAKDGVPATRTGATMGIGRAGKIYIICNTSKGPILTRGGCYSYYEIQGGPAKDEHWERKLEFGLLTPPHWTRKFNIAQDETNGTKINVIEDVSQSGSSKKKL